MHLTEIAIKTTTICVFNQITKKQNKQTSFVWFLAVQTVNKFIWKQSGYDETRIWEYEDSLTQVFCFCF